MLLRPHPITDPGDLSTLATCLEQVGVEAGAVLRRAQADSAWSIWTTWGLTPAQVNTYLAWRAAAPPLERQPIPIAGLPPFRHALALPIQIDGNTVGTIDFLSRAPTWEPGQTAMKLLALAARHISLTIENDTLRASGERSKHEASALLEIALATTPVLDDLLQIIVEIAADLLHVKYCAVQIIDETTNELVFRAARGLPEAALATARLRVGQGLSGAVVRDGLPITVEDLLTAPGAHPFPFMAELGLHGYLGVPLRQHGRTVGVILVYSEHRRRFDEQEIDRLESLANKASIAIENAGLFENLVREKEKFGAIFEHSTDGIMTVNAEQRISAINPALERLLGLSAQALVGQHCRVVLGGCASGGPPRCETDCPWVQVKQLGRPLANTELRIAGPDNAPIDISVSYSWVPASADGEAFGICNIHDITEAKRVEIAKSEFVSTVSHELRTPLALIKGYASTLLRKGLEVEPETRNRYLTNIDDAANKLTRLVNDLLSVSRIQTGILETRPRVFDLAATVRSLVEHWRLNEGTHVFGLSLAAESIPIDADPDRIQQVLENLVGNTTKYSPAGSRIEVAVVFGIPPVMADSDGPWLAVDRPSDQLSPDWVTVTVTDHGCGLSREQMTHIFDKFYRAEASLARSTAGLGLGLYIARGLIEAHQGRIWVESRPEHGSRFAFCLRRPAASPYGKSRER